MHFKKAVDLKDQHSSLIIALWQAYFQEHSLSFSDSCHSQSSLLLLLVKYGGQEHQIQSLTCIYLLAALGISWVILG